MKYFLVFSAFCITIGTASAKNLIVGPGQSFQVIQEAINAASNYDTVIVKKDNYNQHSIIVDKPLYILGQNWPEINAHLKEVDIFIIAADSVTLEGFVLSNVGVSYLKEYAAVKVRKSRFGRIHENQIRRCFFGGGQRRTGLGGLVEAKWARGHAAGGTGHDHATPAPLFPFFI